MNFNDLNLNLNFNNQNMQNQNDNINNFSIDPNDPGYQAFMQNFLLHQQQQLASQVTFNNNSPQQQRPHLLSQQQKPHLPPNLNAGIAIDLETAPIVSKQKMSELLKEIDKNEIFDPDVEDLLLDISQNFVKSVVEFACSLSHHRGSDTIELKDVYLPIEIEQNYNIKIPGFVDDSDELKLGQSTTKRKQNELLKLDKERNIYTRSLKRNSSYVNNQAGAGGKLLGKR